jgi:uncharacterized protein
MNKMAKTYQLIDSSFLYALFHSNDKNHVAAANFVFNSTDFPLVPDVTLPEVSFLFLRDVGHYELRQFMKSLGDASIEFQPISIVDIQRAYEIAETYASAQFDLVDCCIMALSERLNITQVCTFDRRDFAIFRPKHCPYLELLP